MVRPGVWRTAARKVAFHVLVIALATAVGTPTDEVPTFYDR